MSDPYDVLRTAALEVLPRAYAPYSKHPVGAAAMDANGKIHTGVNVENASFGLTQCAEGSLIGAWKLATDAPLTHLVCLNASGHYITPCGRCRQVLHEFCAPDFLVATVNGPVTLEWLLPAAFGPRNLDS